MDPMQSVEIFSDFDVRVRLIRNFSRPDGVQQLYDIIKNRNENFNLNRFSADSPVISVSNMFGLSGIPIESVTLRNVKGFAKGIPQAGVYFFLDDGIVVISPDGKEYLTKAGDILSIRSLKGNPVNSQIRIKSAEDVNKTPLTNIKKYLVFNPVYTIQTFGLVLDTSLVPIPNANLFIRQQRSEQDSALALESPDGSLKYYAVYDGHGGYGLDSDHMGSVLANGYGRLAPLHQYLTPIIKLCSTSPELCTQKIVDLFVKYDNEAKDLKVSGGSTAAILIELNRNGRKQVWIVNVGDSPVILYNASGKLTFATNDHNPREPEEEKRLFRVSTQTLRPVVRLDRIHGVLAVSRAFGDFSLKSEEYRDGRPEYDNLNGALIVKPDVWYMELLEPTSAILTSDGILEAQIAYQDLIDQIRGGKSLEQIFEMNKSRTTDDVAMISVQL